MNRTRPPMPRARKDELVVEHLPDETLVYDLTRHKAHCLNRAAAIVWRRSDGRTSIEQMAGMLEDEAMLPRDEKIVRLALDRLRKAKLLEDETAGPGEATVQSRREVARRLALGGLAILLPQVATLISPVAAMAASTTTNRNCKMCQGVGLPCSDRPGRTCLPRVGKKKKGCACI